MTSYQNQPQEGVHGYQNDRHVPAAPNAADWGPSAGAGAGAGSNVPGAHGAGTGGPGAVHTANGANDFMTVQGNTGLVDNAADDTDNYGRGYGAGGYGAGANQLRRTEQATGVGTGYGYGGPAGPATAEATGGGPGPAVAGGNAGNTGYDGGGPGLGAAGTAGAAGATAGAGAGAGHYGHHDTQTGPSLATNAGPTGKVSTSDRVMGSIEKVAGSITGNRTLAARGEARKLGDHTATNDTSAGQTNH